MSESVKAIAEGRSPPAFRLRSMPRRSALFDLVTSSSLLRLRVSRQNDGSEHPGPPLLHCGQARFWAATKSVCFVSRPSMTCNIEFLHLGLGPPTGEGIVLLSPSLSKRAICVLETQ
jgi:hypothetical protein